MVGNAWEITHSPAPGGGVVVRGGSWYDFALYAKTFFRFASRADARNGTIGFRCCSREAEREEPREVPLEMASRMERRLAESRRRGLLYPYEILRLLIALTAMNDVASQLKELSATMKGIFNDPIKGFGVLSDYARKHAAHAPCPIGLNRADWV